MVCAAADSLIDFRRADPLSPRWQRHVDIILDELLVRQELEWKRLDYQYLLMACQESDLAATARQDLRQQLFELRQQLYQGIQRFRPDVAGNEARRSMAQQLRDAWVRVWGDPNDPAVQAKIDRVAEALRSEREASKPRGRQGWPTKEAR